LAQEDESNDTQMKNYVEHIAFVEAPRLDEAHEKEIHADGQKDPHHLCETRVEHDRRKGVRKTLQAHDRAPPPYSGLQLHEEELEPREESRVVSFEFLWGNEHKENESDRSDNAKKEEHRDAKSEHRVISRLCCCYLGEENQGSCLYISRLWVVQRLKERH